MPPGEVTGVTCGKPRYHLGSHGQWVISKQWQEYARLRELRRDIRKLRRRIPK